MDNYKNNSIEGQIGLLSPDDFEKSIENYSEEEKNMLRKDYYDLANMAMVVQHIEDINRHLFERDKVFDNIFNTIEDHRDGIDNSIKHINDLTERICVLERNMKYLNYLGWVIATFGVIILLNFI